MVPASGEAGPEERTGVADPALMPELDDNAV